MQDGDRREVLSGSSARVPGLSGSLSPAAPEHKADLGVHHKPWDWTSVPPGQHTQACVALCRATGAGAEAPVCQDKPLGVMGAGPQEQTPQRLDDGCGAGKKTLKCLEGAAAATAPVSSVDQASVESGLHWVLPTELSLT